MTTSVQRLSTKKSPVQSPKFNEDLSEEHMNKISEALKSPSNIDALMRQISSATKSKMESSFRNSELLSPIKRATFSAVQSPNSTVRFFEPMGHLDSSDEDECTFHPKINTNAGRLTTRPVTNETIHVTLHKLAFDREVKGKEKLDQHLANIAEKNSTAKTGAKSIKIIFQKLQKAIKSLVNANESTENPGHISFEGLGTVLYQLGVFQTLEFKPQGNDGERSSLSINQAKVKPERLSKEIIFHENLWRICGSVSSDTNFISADLVFKFFMVLVEEKTPLADAAYILLEIMDMALEATGKTREEDKSLYKEVMQEKNLWSLETVIMEFRKLFDDKTSFMNIYSSSNVIAENKLRNHREYAHPHKPLTNQKTQKLDNRFFNETLVKRMTATDPELTSKELADRRNRLYNYHKYLLNKKGLDVEARIQEELAPCTFTPKTKKYAKKKTPQNKTNESSHENGRLTSSPSKKGYFHQALDDCGAQRHMLLYEVAQHYKEKLQQKAYSLKKQEEIGELSYCTFNPRLNVGYENSAARGQDFYEGVPNGFKKVVERMHKGDELKQTRQAEREKVPRGENYEKNRLKGFNPPTQLSRPKIKKPEVLVTVDVSIGHGKTGRIGIHKGDNARTLALNFSRTHSLNAAMRESLETLLQSYIDSYFAQLSVRDKAPEEAEQNKQESQNEGDHTNRPQEEQEEEEEEDEEDDRDDEDEHNEEEEEEDDEEVGLEEVGEDEEGEREDNQKDV